MPDVFPLLEGSEDYPRWVKHAKAQLQEKACLDDVVLSPVVMINTVAATAYLLEWGFLAEEITKQMTYSHIEKENIRLRKSEFEAIGLLKSLVSQENQESIEGLTAH